MVSPLRMTYTLVSVSRPPIALTPAGLLFAAAKGVISGTRALSAMVTSFSVSFSLVLYSKIEAEGMLTARSSIFWELRRGSDISTSESFCARASLPKREDIRLALAAWAGTKNTPNRIKDAIKDLNIFTLGFIKQTKYREISFLILIL